MGVQHSILWRTFELARQSNLHCATARGVRSGAAAGGTWHAPPRDPRPRGYVRVVWACLYYWVVSWRAGITFG